jgi:protoporphyrinogen oxidase
MVVDALIIGAGPAGLTAALELTRSGRTVVVVERDPSQVGGISRTVEYKGCRLDIGGHRFFSKNAEIEALWTDILGDEMLVRPRSSRIYYGGKLFDYPLRAMDAFSKLGPMEALRCVLSYAKAQVAPFRPATTFEQWVVNTFGRRLFEIFFKTYTEKVWGMPCDEISADWAAQRIKGLNLYEAIIASFGSDSGSEDGIKTLIRSFRYPRLGPGQMWDRVRDLVVDGGGSVAMGTTVGSLRQEAGRWTAVLVDSEGRERTVLARNVVSTAAIDELVPLLGIGGNDPAGAAAAGLRYRDFLIVALIARGPRRFDDNWIYIHDPAVKVGRIQNFASWSPEMVPDAATSCYGMEYFCFAGDDTWSMPDEDLLARARAEITKLGLSVPDDIVDGVVVRQPKAYPIYDDAYRQNLDIIRRGLDERFTGLHLAGRNGMHKYNNQDHAMMTGLLVARNIVAGTELVDPWAVNDDAGYHEAGVAGIEERLVPRRVVA